MIYMLDTANVEEIKRGIECYPITGVTTNPSILASAGGDWLETLKLIRKTIGSEMMLHAQVISTDFEGILSDAKKLKDEVGGNLYIKVPVNAVGIKAIKRLKKDGYNITATAIYTPQQALMAAVAGAEYLAPYVNRIENNCGDGIEVVADIVGLIDTYDLNAKVLAASFKNAAQVHRCSVVGSHSITAAPEIIDALLNHASVDWSIEKFVADWEKAFGKKTF